MLFNHKKFLIQGQNLHWLALQRAELIQEDGEDDEVSLQQLRQVRQQCGRRKEALQQRCGLLLSIGKCTFLRLFINADPVNFVFLWVPVTGIRW